MRIINAVRDVRGTTLIEFALTAPLFFAFVLGITFFGLAAWTQVGLQHGAEMAARCATVDKIVCTNATTIKTYAAQQTLGINPSPSVFTVSETACGNTVTASYSFEFLTDYFPMDYVTLTAYSCFPK